MSWWQSMPSAVVSVLFFLLPGLAFSYAARIRGFSAILLAPLFTVALVGLASVALPVLHAPWRPWTFALTAVVVIGVTWGIRALIARRFPDPEFVPMRRSWTTAAWISLATAAILIAVLMAAAIGQPDNISQTYDNVFHLNAIEWAIQSGNASPFNLGAFTGISAYPSAWHAVVALIVQLTGVSIPVGVTVTNLAIGAVAWPMSVMYLVHVVAGPRLTVNLLAGLFSASYSAFPILMIDWGVLYPNFLSIAVLPAALGLGFSALRLGRLWRPSSPVAWTLFAVAAPAVALAHPSSMMALLIFLAPAALTIYVFRMKVLSPFTSARAKRQAFWLTACLGIVIVIFVLLWRVFRPPVGSANWGPVESSAQAIGEILLSSPMGRPAAVIVGLSLVVGLVHLWRTRSRRWMIGLFGIAALLYFYAAGVNVSPRWFLTGVWYFDSNRLAALMPVASVAIAVVGAVALWDGVRGHLSRLRTRSDKLGRIFSAAVKNAGTRRLTGVGVAVVLLVGTQWGITTFAAEQAAWRYVMTDKAPLLSTDERTLLERLPGEVPADDVIAGMPSNGSALAYAYAQRRVVQPHILTTHGPEVDVVNAGLKSADWVPQVCDAIRKLNVKWVLDFGTRSVTGTLPGYGGVVGLEGSHAVALADQQGTAKLYRVVACWGDVQ